MTSSHLGPWELSLSWASQAETRTCSGGNSELCVTPHGKESTRKPPMDSSLCLCPFDFSVYPHYMSVINLT